MAVRDGVLRQIGVDTCGPDADENRKIMRIETFGRTHRD